MDDILRRAYKPIEKALALFEERLAREADGKFPYPSFLFSGKRLRPACVFFMARAFEEIREPAIRAALAVEFLHAGTLVHDDIIDGSSERRGDESIHRKYGIVGAVLAGDNLFVKSLRQVNSIGNPELMEEFLSSCEKALEGEQMEERLSPPESLLRENYIRIISLKTAEIFALSSSLGAKIACYSQNDTLTLRRAGQSFGMAYQIIDDCEDMLSAKDGDLAAGKFTLPVIEAAALLDGLSETLISGRFNPERVKEEVIESGGLALALERASEYIEEARSLVSAVGDPELESSISGFFSYLEERAGIIRI
ncbi:MAG: polyprenyl synthetase family protein [candidate division WOR-3 bacterium]